MLYSFDEKKQKLAITPILTSEGVISLREAALMGLGIAILPEWQAEDLPAYIVYPVQRRLPLRVRMFIDFAISYMATYFENRAVTWIE